MAQNKAYREAERKIEAAQRTGAKELDLGKIWDAQDSEQLTELSESLGQLTPAFACSGVTGPSLAIGRASTRTLSI